MELCEYGPVLASGLSPEYIHAHDLWRCRSACLPRRLERLLNGEESLPTNQVGINIKRLGAAVGGNGSQRRVGLAFSSSEQQGRFAAEFSDLMVKHGYGTFSLVGTGTSFQGLSTNPDKPKHWMFGSGALDLDLQIYCPPMVERARVKLVSLFPNMFVYEGDGEPRMARLSTFKNYSEAPEQGLDAIAPWVAEFEKAWAVRLRATYDRDCAVHIALMNLEAIPDPQLVLGSPFELIRAVDGVWRPTQR